MSGPDEIRRRQDGGLIAGYGYERMQMLYWLLRAYDSGHRKGWEGGHSVQEAMDGLHTFLCNLGYDPNAYQARVFMRHVEMMPESARERYLRGLAVDAPAAGGRPEEG